MKINFDMDGTIADLYGVTNWLQYLQNNDTTPYEIAKPLIDLRLLARALNRLQKQGYEINIISWLSKNGTEEYNLKVTQAKIKWLRTHLKSVHWDNIYIVPYGTPKNKISNGILFDDEILNRTAWGNSAYNPNEILEVLKTLSL